MIMQYSFKSLKQKDRQLLISGLLLTSLTSCLAGEPSSVDSERLCSTFNLAKDSEFYDRYFHETFSFYTLQVFSIVKQKLLTINKPLNDSYMKLLNENISSRDMWIRQNVTSSPAQGFYHQHDGELIGFYGCKPKACDTNKIYILFSPITKKISITLEYPNGSKSFGQLPSTLKSECFKKVNK